MSALTSIGLSETQVAKLAERFTAPIVKRTSSLSDKLGFDVDEAVAQLDTLARSIRSTRAAMVGFVQPNAIEREIDRAVELVADEFRVHRCELTGRGRTALVAMARQCLYSLLRETGMSSAEIGRRLKREHGSVLHGFAAWQDRMASDKRAAQMWEEILNKWWEK